MAVRRATLHGITPSPMSSSFQQPWCYRLRDDPHAFNAFAEPLPLVVEISFRTTGDYDIAAKRPGYRERGDAEIWFIHPYERTLTAWRRQPDGTYTEDLYRGGLDPRRCSPRPRDRLRCPVR